MSNLQSLDRAATSIRNAKRSAMNAAKQMSDLGDDGDFSSWLRPCLTMIGLSDELLRHIEACRENLARSLAQSEKSPRRKPRNRIDEQVLERSNSDGTGLEAGTLGDER